MPFVVKNTSFPGLLNLLAPHSCRGCGSLGDPLCECCKIYITSAHQRLCPQCKQPLPTIQTTLTNCPNCPDLPPIYAVGARTGVLALAIHDYKYLSTRALASSLASILDRILPALPTDTIIVPLPTATHHIRTRGFDHTMLLSRRLAHLRHLKSRPLLLRAKNTVQVGANAATRIKQASSAYQLNPKYPITPNVTYLLIDDVWTTGATIKAATKLLQSSGAKNIIVALLAYSA